MTRRCALPGCATPDVLLTMRGPRRYHPACRLLMDRCRQTVYRRSKGIEVREGYAAGYVNDLESAESIDARFTAALVEVRRTPRETLIGWSSPLARLT